MLANVDGLLESSSCRRMTCTSIFALFAFFAQWCHWSDTVQEGVNGMAASVSVMEHWLALHDVSSEPAQRNGRALMQVVMETSTRGDIANATEIAEQDTGTREALLEVPEPIANYSRVTPERKAVDQWHKAVASQLERSIKAMAPMASNLIGRSEGQSVALIFLVLLLAGAFLALGILVYLATGSGHSGPRHVSRGIGHSGQFIPTNGPRGDANLGKDWHESSCSDGDSLTSDSQLSLTPHPRGSAGLVDKTERLSIGELRQDFCPALVVPHGHECILNVPKPQPEQIDSFDVEDLQGNPLIRAEVMPAARATGNTIVKLKALFQPPGSPVSAGTTLAFCKVTQVTIESGSCVQVYSGRNELFAHLSKVTSMSQLQALWNGAPGRADFRPCYLLNGIKSGPKVLFHGNFQEDAVFVTNEFQELMADTEPTSCVPGGRRCFKLRVSSNVDVGVILCGLLSIAQMEAQ